MTQNYSKLTSGENQTEEKVQSLEKVVAREKQKTKNAEEETESLSLLVSSVKDYAIFLLDVNGNVATWNAGAERIKGYRAEEIIGQNFSRFYPEEDLAWGKPQWELEVAQKVGRFEDEGWRIRKDGSRFWANVVITALFDKQGQLKGFGKVTRDLTERKMAEEKIRHLNVVLEKRVRERTAQLEEANRTKDILLRQEKEARLLADKAVKEREQFLTIAAHELKTPITSLRGFAQLLARRMEKQSEVDLDSLKKVIEVFETQTEKLNQLTLRLLDISRLQTGKVTIERERTDLVLLVRRIIDNAQAGTENHLIQFDAPETLWCLIDPIRFEQVVTNLVQNAIKYSPNGGPIEINLGLEKPGLIRLAVQDRGVGIALEDRNRVFEIFYQGDQATFGGLGIGLYISRQIVEMHNGEIFFEIPEEGGTRFVVKIPKEIDNSISPGFASAPSSLL